MEWFAYGGTLLFYWGKLCDFGLPGDDEPGRALITVLQEAMVTAFYREAGFL